MPGPFPAPPKSQGKGPGNEVDVKCTALGTRCKPERARRGRNIQFKYGTERERELNKWKIMDSYFVCLHKALATSHAGHPPTKGNFVLCRTQAALLSCTYYCLIAIGCIHKHMTCESTRYHILVQQSRSD